jgi:hypothetical protein
MDKALDGGVEWRRRFAPFLEDKGVVVFDPTNKPIGVGREDIEDRELRNRLKENDQYDELARQVHLLRIIDLGMVDRASFIICNLDLDVPTCGTWEEMFWANRLKNPILIHIEQGKAACPDWLFGVLPHQHIFGEWDDLEHYLTHVDEDEVVDHYKRWMFFDYTRMMPKVPPRHMPDFKPW